VTFNAFITGLVVAAVFMALFMGRLIKNLGNMGIAVDPKVAAKQGPIMWFLLLALAYHAVQYGPMIFQDAQGGVASDWGALFGDNDYRGR
jgi:hypothetical protein